MNKYQRARAWREGHGLTRAQLAERTGWSPEAIYWFEEGHKPPRPGQRTYYEIEDWVFMRYRLACAGVEHELKTGRVFNW